MSDKPKRVKVYFENNYRGILLVASALLSNEDLIETTHYVYSLPDVDRLVYQILDISKVERMDLSLPTLEYLANIDKEVAEQLPGMRIAVVAKPGIVESLTKMWENLSRHPKLSTKVCYSLQEARTWIEEVTGHTLSH